MTETQKWIDKVQKLLAKAERAGSKEEAEAFSEKAYQIMSQYAISEAMLDFAATQGVTVDKVERQAFAVPNPYAQPKLILLDKIADVFNVKVYYVPHSQAYAGKHHRNAYLVGFPGDIERTKVLFESLERQVETFRKLDEAKNAYWMGRGEKKVFHASFIRSFSLGVYRRLRDIYRAERDKQPDPTTTALVLTNRREAVDAFMQENVPNLRTQSSSAQQSALGMIAGASAAKQANLGHSVGSGNRKGLS